MNHKHLMSNFSLITAMLLIVCTGNAHAGEITVTSTGTFSGSFVSTISDTNFDGVKASLFTGAGEDSVSGRYTTQSTTEHFVTGQGTCENGSPGTEMSLVPGTGAFVNRHDGGELLFGEYVSSSQCIDLATNTIFYNYTVRFTGGTGPLEGATGTSEGQGEANSKVLLQDQAGNFFGASSGRYSTTLTLPTED